MREFGRNSSARKAALVDWLIHFQVHPHTHPRKSECLESPPSTYFTFFSLFLSFAFFLPCLLLQPSESPIKVVVALAQWNRLTPHHVAGPGAFTGGPDGRHCRSHPFLSPVACRGKVFADILGHHSGLRCLPWEGDIPPICGCRPPSPPCLSVEFFGV